MLVLYKVRNGGLRYCFSFCNESEKCKKKKEKKDNVNTLKTLSREVIFCCFVPFLFDWIFAVSVKKRRKKMTKIQQKIKSTPELLYSIEIFS